MSVDTDRLISFFILWGTPAVFSIVEYFKLSKTEKNEAIRDLNIFKIYCNNRFYIDRRSDSEFRQVVISAASPRYRYFYFSNGWYCWRY